MQRTVPPDFLGFCGWLACWYRTKRFGLAFAGQSSTQLSRWFLRNWWKGTSWLYRRLWPIRYESLALSRWSLDKPCSVYFRTSASSEWSQSYGNDLQGTNGVDVDCNKDYNRDIGNIQLLLHFLENENDVLQVNLHSGASFLLIIIQHQPNSHYQLF